MRNLSRRIRIIFIVAMILALSQSVVFADTFEFDPSGETKNPFTPRGYMIEKGESQRAYWMSSSFDNSGEEVKYSGNENGLDYIDADEAGTIYALTDRNPTPGKQYLSAYKNGNAISNFSSYIGTPTRADIQTTGKSTGWKIPIEGFKLEKGCRYEFAFLRGMQANNGITLVFSEDGKGYIQNPSTKAERDKYNADRYDEYEFIVSYEKDTDPDTNENHYFNFYMVPMRFTIQTYADMSKWEKKADEAQEFLDSVTEKQLDEGVYRRSNIKTLKALLSSLNQKAKTEVRKELQPEADKQIEEMIAQLEAMLKKAKSDKPEAADISELLKTIEEAEALYDKASVNVGTDIGQYGAFEVENLRQEIAAAKEMDKFTPQNEINDEVDALEAAMIEVRNSLRQEDMLYFYDKATGIYVIAPATSLPEDAKLYVRRMSDKSKEYQVIEKNLSDKETEAIYYRIQFYQDEFQIQPEEEVEVQIPIDINISQKSSTVYAVDSKGKLTEIDSVKSQGTQIFKTDKLSALVMAGSAATEAEKAAARSDRMQNLMAQRNDDQADNKEEELSKIKRKQEEYKDPLNKLLKRNQNTASFSSDVQQETDPIYLIAVAILLAVAAVGAGARGIWEMRSSENKKGGKHA